MVAVQNLRGSAFSALVSVIFLINIGRTLQESSDSPYWKEHWSELHQNVSQVYIDDYLAFYLDDDAQRLNNTWPFYLMSKTWEFVHSLHNGTFLGEDPHLYIIFHDKKYDGIHSQPYSEATPDHSNVIDCGQENLSEIAKGSKCSVGSLMDKLHEILVNIFTESNSISKPTNLAFEWRILDILLYDILIKLNETSMDQGYTEEIISRKTDYPQKNTFLFRDWYLPIYNEYGGNETIQKFLNLCKEYGEPPLLPGEFVHIWSQASGVDLRDLAYKAFGWNSDYRGQYELAKEKFNFYNYTETAKFQFPYWQEHWYEHKQNMSLVYEDPQIAFYFDSDVKRNETLWPFLPISEAWKLVLKLHDRSIFGKYHQLFMILHDQKYNGIRVTTFTNETHDFRNVIDCGQNDPDQEKGNRPCNLGSMVEQIHILMKKIIIEQPNTQPINLVHDWRFLDIFVYDYFIKTGDSSSATEFKEQVEDKQTSYPRESSRLLRDWYFPIYEGHGGSATLQKFLDLCGVPENENQTKPPSRGPILPGEFVHLWSEASGSDLRDLAYKAFGWTRDYRSQFDASKEKSSIYNYSVTINSSPPQNWTEHWEDHNHDLNLVYSDNHVAIYFDADVHLSVTWPFQLLSQGWSYAKETYGPLSYDPILYIILHEKKVDCKTSKDIMYLDQDYENKNIIDCGQSHTNAWDVQTNTSVDLLMENIGFMILKNYNETGNWPGYKTSRWTYTDILVYDMYRGINRTSDANRWYVDKLNKTKDVPVEKTYWFRDWLAPIYNKSGNGQVFVRFLSILNANWPQEEHAYKSDYDLGTMVHFWSGAVGENLWYLAADAFSWSAWDHKRFLRARENYPNVVYDNVFLNSTVTIPPIKWTEKWDSHKEALDLVFLDSHLAVYFDDDMDITVTTPFKPLSRGWSYAKKTYGPIGPDPILFLVLHDSKHSGCKLSRGDSYDAPEFDQRTVIDCGNLYDTWKLSYSITYVMQELGNVIMRGAKQTGKWPAFQVSKGKMVDILSYDIYMGVGMTNEAVQILYEKTNDKSSFPEDDTYWFRDWFYPIYAQYGHANVLNNFLDLLKKHWPKNSNVNYADYAKNLNVGEFVHFWSGAAGVNLKYLANKTFGWPEKYEMELNEAQREYNGIKYEEAETSNTANLHPLILMEEQFNHNNTVLKAYWDTHVLGFSDVDVNRSVRWPFFLLSQCWTRGKNAYSTMQSSNEPVLKVVLHATRHAGCRTSWNLTNSGTYEGAIDCGKQQRDGSNAWGKDSPENTDKIIAEFVKLLELSANQTHVEETFSQFLTFDTYLSLQRFQDAYRVFNRTAKKFEVTVGSGPFWMRDWYLPIYTMYGGRSVLNSFLNLLSTNWSQEKGSRKATVTMNIGQVVHFWSEATGQNMFKLAAHTFRWNLNQQNQFKEARAEYNQFSYACYDCHITKNATEIQNHSFAIGISMGFACIIAVAIIVPLVIYKRKLSSLQEQIRELSADEIKEFFEGNANANTDDGYASIESKPFNTAYEIARERLNVLHDNILGSGEFGLVLRGVVKGDPEKHEVDVTVAVKTVKPNVDVSCFKALLTELKVMSYLGAHDNIASLVGALTVNIKHREVYVALEFCAKGDLLGYIKKNRENYNDMFGKSTSLEVPKERKLSQSTLLTDTLNNIGSRISNVSVEAPALENERVAVDVDLSAVVFSTMDLLEWSSQVASGMAYIASKKVIHGDLAARNILLKANNVAKISDFGLSRQLANYSNYMKTSKTPVPCRWMAIESLRDMNFSVQSDAWAYGVTLYEIFSLGTTPYSGWTWDYEFVEKLVAGHRLSSPEFADENIYAIMMDCMKKEPADRLTFPAIVHKLNEVKFKLCPQPTGIINSNYIQLGR